MNEILYASAIGSIMYAMLCTCPNVFHALSVTSGYQVILVRVTGSGYKRFSSKLIKEVFLVDDKKGMSFVISGYDVAEISSLCERGSVPSSAWQESARRKELRYF